MNLPKFNWRAISLQDGDLSLHFKLTALELADSCVDWTSVNLIVPSCAPAHRAQHFKAMYPSTAMAGVNGTASHDHRQWTYSMTQPTADPSYQSQPLPQPQYLQNPSFNFDPRNLEIKTKSIERTLLPLVTQVCYHWERQLPT